MQCQNVTKENLRVAMVNVSTVPGFVMEKTTAGVGVMKSTVLNQVYFSSRNLTNT